MDQRVAIIITWLNHSGKSYIAKKIKEQYDQYCILGTDPIHELALKEFPDLYVKAKLKKWLWETSPMVDYEVSNLKHFYIKVMIQFVIANWFIPLLENCNSRKSYRQRHTEYLHNLGYKVLILYINPWIEVIKERFKNWLLNHKNENLYHKWFDWNVERQQWFYEPPEDTEWDYFIETDGNIEELFVKLNHIIHAKNT